MQVDWQVLGGLGAVVDGAAVRPTGRQRTAVLALLLLGRNRIVAMDRFVDELWPSDPPQTARNTVQRFISDLRSSLGPARQRLETAPNGYRLVVEHGELDLDRLEARATAATHAADIASAGENGSDAGATWIELTATIDVLAQTVCPGAEHLETVASERVRLASIRVDLMDRAGALALTTGLGRLDHLQRWAAEHPLNEQLAIHLVRALARSGRQVEALSSCDQLRRRLRRELGISPSPALEAVELEVLQGRESLQPSPHLERAVQVQPVTGSELIGRDELLGQIEAALGQARLVTLVGPGGSGKSALASRLARTWAPDPSAAADLHAHVCLLADLTEPTQVVEAVADAIGVDPTDLDDRAQLAGAIGRALAGWSGLLVIDNAEHVIEGVAELVAELMAEPSEARMLVTSREHLAVPGERVVDVGPLALPDPDRPGADSSAVQLLARRGADVGRLSYEELLAHPASGEICRGVDGLPLAIELAAAQLRALSPEELADRIDRPLEALGFRRGPRRQSSLEAALDWSWDLLDDDERRLLGRLAAFRGWPLDAVEFLEPADGLRLLASLVAKSLVQVGPGPGGSTRYRLLDTVRNYAWAKADEAGWSGQDEQAAWVLARARRHPLVESLSVVEAVEAIDGERHNVLIALRRLDEQGRDTDLVELVTRAGGAFAHRGPLIEGRRWAEVAAARLEADPEATVDQRGALLAMSASLANAVGDLAQMAFDALAAVELGGDEPYDWLPGVLGVIANLSEASTLTHDSLHLLEQAERLAPRTPSRAVVEAEAAAWRGSWELMSRNHDDAIAHFARSIELDGRPGRSLLLAETGTLAALHLSGRHDEAIEAANRMTSQGDTDVWHYIVDVNRAVCIGAERPAEGARILEAVLANTVDEELPGRADDVRIATAVLAWWAGDIARCVQLLERPIGRMPSTVTFLMEYVEGTPGKGMAHQDWCAHWFAHAQARIKLLDEPAEHWVTSQPKPKLVRDTIERLRTG